MQRISGPPLSNIFLIEPQSSLDFVRTAFRLYENHELFAFSKPGTAADFPSEINVRRGAPMLDKRGWFEEPHEPIVGPTPAQITYTSGTTGSSKGIILSHDNLADTVRRLVDFQKLDSTVAEYVGVPAHYSFGLARFRACAAVGGRAYIPARGFDPLELGRMLRDGEINSLAAVPSLLRLLLGQPTVIGNAGRVLRWLEIGSQPMTRAEKERLKTIFPEAHITQHYGLTEASRTTLLDVSAAKAHVLDSVGKPVGETEIGLSSDGRIMVRGPHVARHWINRSGVHPLVDSDGWLTTGDNGLIDPDGHLHFRGRADDVINFGGIKLAPELIEDGVRARQTHPIRLAVARIPHRERGEGILLATDGPNADLDALRSTALEVLSGLGVAAGGWSRSPQNGIADDRHRQGAPQRVGRLLRGTSHRGT